MAYRKFKIDFSDKAAIRTGTDGYQLKFVKDDYFIKAQCELQGCLKKDWRVEVIATEICKFYSVYAVLQRPCMIDISKSGKIYGRYGVYSNNFEKNGYTFVSCERLFNLNQDILNTRVYIKLDARQKLYYIAERISVYAGLDKTKVLNYLFNMLFVDLLVLNQDRHSHNFGVFWNNNKNQYEVAMLFDFGMGLFENTNDKYNTLDEYLRYSYLEPFGEDPFYLAEVFLKDNNFMAFLKNKQSSGLLNISDRIFPSKLAYMYFCKMKEVLKV